MIIKKLTLINFRKFKDLNLTFKPGINIIHGPNGSGKTSVLDSIAFTVYGASLDELKRKNLIHFNASSSYVEILINNEKNITISRTLSSSRKGLIQSTQINNKETPILDYQNFMIELFGERSWFDTFIEVDQADVYNLINMPNKILEETIIKNMAIQDILNVINNTHTLKNKISVELVRLRYEYNDILKQHQEINTMFNRFKDYDKSSIDITKINEAQENLNLINNQISILTKLNDNLYKYKDNNTQLLNLFEHLPNNIIKYSDTHNNMLRNIMEIYTTLNNSFEKINLNKIYKYSNNLYSNIDNILNSINKIKLIATSINENCYDELENIHNNTLLLGKSYETLQLELLKMEERIDILEMTNKRREILHNNLKELNNRIDNLNNIIKIKEDINTSLDITSNLYQKLWEYEIKRILIKIIKKTNKYLRDIDMNFQLTYQKGNIKAKINNHVVYVNSLSGGQKALLNLILKICLIEETGKTNMLLLDEPLVFIDPRIKFSNLLTSLTRNFKQIIIATHRDLHLSEKVNRIKL